MKKILEVLLYGDPDLRFDTDLQQAELPRVIPDHTKLWGGKEDMALPKMPS